MNPVSPTRTGWSLRLGRVARVPVRVHFTFLFLIVWYGYASLRQGDDLPLSLAFLAAVFGCVVLHELGHALAARRFGVRTREIVLYPIGGVARLENVPGGKAELWIALAGPAVNLALGFGLLAVMSSVGVSFSARLHTFEALGTRLALVNLILALFNMLPAFPMDGGRVLRALLSFRLHPAVATRIATAVGQAMAVLFGVLGLLGREPLLVLIALFVLAGATQEAFRVQRPLAGGPAGDGEAPPTQNGPRQRPR